MRRKVALALELILGLGGIFGVGRLITGYWARGLTELIGGIIFVLILWPMLYVPFLGHNALFQVVPQVLIAILLTQSLSRDLRALNQEEV